MTETDVPFQPPESFRCESRQDADRWWLQPAGELDLDTAPLLEQELATALEAGARSLVLDMRALTFMDSTGLRLVIRWDTAAKHDGFDFAIVRGTDIVQRVFRLTGMDEHLPVVDPPDGA